MKTLATILTALVALAAGAQIPGTTTILAPVAPSSTLDTFPSHLAEYGKGSLRTVATLAARDAIADERREEGMLVYVSEDEAVYKLEEDMDTWTLWMLNTGNRVNNLSALLSIPTADLQDGFTVGVLGRSSPGDWGLVRFARWNEGATYSTNTVFVFARTGGQWVFDDRYGPEIDARWFGVVSSPLSGRADTSGIGVAVQLQAACDYAFSNKVPTVVLPAGYISFETTVFPKPGVKLKGQGAYYSQETSTNITMLAGGTALCPMPGLEVPILFWDGQRAAAISSQQTVFTSGDLSYNTNYNFGGGLEGVTIDSAYLGLRGWDIVVDGCFGVVFDDVAFNTYGGRWPMLVRASNVIELRRIKGLTQNPLCLFYSADCIITECSLGGGVGPKIWLKGSKNILSDSQLFNSQAQSSTVRQVFTANASTDTITVSDSAGGLKWFTGMPVSIEAADGATLPGGLATNQVFYLIRTAGTDLGFKLNSRYTYNSSGTGGALQGVAMDISSAGSGTFTIGPGPTANLLVDEYDQNQIINVRMDQSAGDAIQFWGASENTVIGSSMTESGWNASSTNWSAVRMMGASRNNRFVGNLIRNRSATSKAGFGLTADAGSTNNFWVGQISGVTNEFGANPNTWFAQRWDPSNQRMEVYSSGWRGIGTMPNGVAGVSYDLPGIMHMTAPTSGIPAAIFDVTSSTETVRTFAYADADGQGTTFSTYSYGGTAAAPSQYAAERLLWRVVSHAGNEIGTTFSIAEVGTRTEGAVSTNGTPTSFFVATTPAGSTNREVHLKVHPSGSVELGHTQISHSTADPTNIAFRVNSTKGVFMHPEMTSTQRDAIVSPPTNGVIANITTHKLERWTGSAWEEIGAGVAGGSVDSVFGRTGTVTAQSGDYSASQITGLAEQIRDDAGASLVGTNGATVTIDDSADKILIGVSIEATNGLAINIDTNLNKIRVGVTGIATSLITGLDEQVRDVIGTAIVAGSNIVSTVDDAGNTITLSLATNLVANQIDVTTLNAGTLNMATVAAGAVVSTNSLKVGATTITDLDQLQPVNANLTAAAAVSTTGLRARTGSGTEAAVSIVAGSSKISVTGGNGASGNPSIDAVESAFTLNNIGGTLGSTKGGLGTNAVTAKSLLVGNGSGPVKALVGTNVLAYYGADGTPMVLGLGANLSTDGTNLIAAGGGGGGGSITYNGTAVTNITSGPDIVGDVSSGNLTLRRPAPGTLTDGATISTVASNGVYFYTTVQGARTLANPTSLVAGRQLTWEITQGTNMATTLTLGSAFKGSLEVPIPSDRNLILSTNAGHIHLIEGVVLSDGASVLLKTWRSGIN